MIRNLLKPDYRFSHWKAVRKAELKQEKRLYIQQLIGVAFLGFLAGVILTKSLYDAGHRNVLPTGLREVEKVQEVKADEPTDEYYHQEPIRYIRHRGEELGKDNATIMTMIRISFCESGHRENAVNVNVNKTIDRGIFQLNSIHKGISNKDAFDFVKNIDYAWKMQTAQGFSPWNSSKHCWNK